LGKPILSDRIIESAKTISELKRLGARIVILAHQGRAERIYLFERACEIVKQFVKIKYINDILEIGKERY